MSARLRCAIYTRKSTEEGLEQAFNSLDAQRESCEAYVLSQAGEGWECLPQHYDDGGWSGGNMERPALKQLLEDIGKGRIDIVVVYKVDRLTRSLMDFARIVETFDSNKTSFVSVTQAFNTTTSMGRLTLNVLLSFAQFEREVTGERISDKIAASRAKGMWMGGTVPLGYDLEERRLVINTQEAQTVRHIFTRYTELKSLVPLARELNTQGIVSKRWTARNGNSRGGRPFNCGTLSHILKNRTYLGEVVHKGRYHPGEHPAILDKTLFDAVQDQLAHNHNSRTTRKTKAATCPFTNKLYDQDGQPMRPSFSYGRGKKIYRYYISECLLPYGRIGNVGNLKGQRIPAMRIEMLIATTLNSSLPEPVPHDAIHETVQRIILHDKHLQLDWDISTFLTEGLTADMMLGRVQHHVDAHATCNGSTISLTITPPPVRRGKTGAPHVRAKDDPQARAELSQIIRTAHRKLELLNASPLHPELHLHMRVPINEWTRMRIALGFLAPDIQKALLQGTAPAHITPEMLLSPNMPLDWNEQRRMFGMAG